jgi:hypothetical protein
MWAIAIYLLSFSLVISKITIEPIPVPKLEPIPLMATTTPAVPKRLSTTTNSIVNSGLQDLVRKEFADAPIMIEIARCESRFRQFEEDGSVFRGKINPKDVGLFQVNEHYHLEASRKLGIDIHTAAGNIAYARILYKANGTRDWNWSKSCWNPGSVKTEPMI